MWRYFELLSFRPLGDIEALRQGIEDGRNPRDVKFELAAEIVARFHDATAAERAQAAFIERFAQKSLPTDLPLIAIADPDGTGVRLATALKEAGLVASNSEAGRKIVEGAVRIDGQKVADRELRLGPGTECILQVGPRRFARIRVG